MAGAGAGQRHRAQRAQQWRLHRYVRLLHPAAQFGQLLACRHGQSMVMVTSAGHALFNQLWAANPYVQEVAFPTAAEGMGAL